MMVDDAVHFESYCSKCEERKPISMNRYYLSGELEGKKDVTVVSICGHTWNLSTQEKQILRAALRSGRV